MPPTHLRLVGYKRRAPVGSVGYVPFVWGEADVGTNRHAEATGGASVTDSVRFAMGVLFVATWLFVADLVVGGDGK